jgi:hypothetical protein
MRTRISLFAATMIVAALTVLAAKTTLVGAQHFSFTTLAGTTSGLGYSDGAGSSARFNYPFGVSVDSASNVYVADLLDAGWSLDYAPELKRPGLPKPFLSMNITIDPFPGLAGYPAWLVDTKTPFHQRDQQCLLVSNPRFYAFQF